jgi:hypothetical protein
VNCKKKGKGGQVHGVGIYIAYFKPITHSQSQLKNISKNIIKTTTLKIFTTKFSSKSSVFAVREKRDV